MSIVQGEKEYFPVAKAKPSISADGKNVVIGYTFEDGETMRFGLSAEATRELLHELSVISTISLGNPAAAGGTGFVQMTRAVSAQAEATDEPNEIALCLMNELKTPHFFVLSAETSASLRPGLRAAEAKSKSGARLPRA